MGSGRPDQLLVLGDPLRPGEVAIDVLDLARRLPPADQTDADQRLPGRVDAGTLVLSRPPAGSSDGAPPAAQRSGRRKETRTGTPTAGTPLVAGTDWAGAEAARTDAAKSGVVGT